ncbi:CHAT domain-containing protein [Tenacibaculum amylolyticum]|uniref:CHAT domain-containing protein n=1 Tax=Tenacibaculum amylolyticum TaxID=104269 RepID=UPI0038B6635F
MFFISIVSGFTQEVSATFDSIYKLPEKNIDKLSLYNNLFNTYQKNNDFKQLGLETYELAKKVYKQSIDTAIYYNQKAIDATLKTNPIDSCLLKSCYYNVGFYNKRKKDYIKAIAGYKKSLTLKDCKNLSKGARKHLPKTYFALASHFFQNGDYFTAAKNYQKSLDLTPPNEIGQMINSHTRIGRSYKNMRDLTSGKKALYHFLKADSLYKTLSDQNIENNFIFYNNIAGQYAQNGQHLNSSNESTQNALKYYAKSIELAKKITNPVLLEEFYYNLGITYQTIDLKKAEQYFLKSIDAAHQLENNFKKYTFLGLGITASLNKKHKQAQEYFLKSLVYFLQKENITENTPISDKQLYTVQDKERLLELFRSQMENWDRMLDESQSTEVAKLMIQKAKLSDRLITIMLKEDLSNSSKLLIRNLASEIYILALEACYSINDIKNAFYFAEKNKAILLIQNIKKNSTSIDNTPIIKPTYFSNPNLISILPFEEINLVENEVILHYVMAERLLGKVPDAYGIYISKSIKKIFKIADTDGLITNIKTLRKKLDTPFVTEEDQQNYYNLSNKVLNTIIPTEIQKDLPNKKLTVLGDHILNFIPFEPLIIDKKLNKYLIEICEVRYDYSLTFKEENKNIIRKPSKEFLGIAPIYFDTLTSLKNSEKEILLGKKYYTGETQTDKNTTKQNFINNATNYKILHLATHANASDSIQPWIAFRDSKLSLQELDTIKNNAELVILSACNTSIGKINQGEGVMSLARGFFKSGAKAVIPSLWKTNDKASFYIIATFYKYLHEGQTSSAALRSAKIDYLKTHTDAEASPYYWAPLIIIGDSTPILSQKKYNSLYILPLVIIAVIIFFIIRYRRKMIEA